MRRLAVVIAAYDERDNIEPLVSRLRQTLDHLPGWQWHAIFVVAGTDGTREALERLARDRSDLEILYDSAPSGIGAAFRRGFAAVAPDVDFVVTMDADLNHQPEEISRLLDQAVRRQTDVLVGSRFVDGSSVRGTPLWKRMLSTSMNHLMRYLYRLEVGDKTSGFRVYRAAALRELRFDNDAFAFLPEILIRASAAGMRLGEEPIQFVFREQGRSKMAFVQTTLSYLGLLSTSVLGRGSRRPQSRNDTAGRTANRPRPG